MICIRFPIVSKWAEKNRISFTTYTDLASRPEVYEMIRREVETVNKTLPDAQRIRKFLLLYKELDADDGELTRTRKIRRKFVEERYAQVVEGLGEGESFAEGGEVEGRHPHSLPTAHLTALCTPGPRYFVGRPRSTPSGRAR